MIEVYRSYGAGGGSLERDPVSAWGSRLRGRLEGQAVTEGRSLWRWKVCRRRPYHEVQVAVVGDEGSALVGSRSALDVLVTAETESDPVWEGRGAKDNVR